MSSFKEWAVNSGKLNKDTASTYWSGLINTQFKQDNVPVADVNSLHEFISRIGKDIVTITDIKNLFTKPDYRPDSDIKSFIQKYIEYLKASSNVKQPTKDYENFFAMLKFWVKQTNNNITNDGQRVGFKEIKAENAVRAEAKFNNPQFHKEYITFSDFLIRISFFRNGQYKGNKVNFIVCFPNDFNSGSLNMRYQFDSQQIVVNYRRDLPNNSDSRAFKDNMTELGYETGVTFRIDELGLSEQKPNAKVKALFDYFHEMVSAAKSFRKEGDNLKAFELVEKLKQNYNLILRGAPGTGKTYLAKEIAAILIGIPTENLSSNDQFGFVQFHPSYDYTDFVEGLRPVQINDQVGFEPKSGIFKEFCQNALLHQKTNSGLDDKKYVFVIDEINRGEISKIFGELFFSVDPEYRGVAGSVSTQYANLFEGSEKFYVPENVYIIGTMNDIDRSVDTFDFAMRRRFSFEEITATDSQVMLQMDEVKNRMNFLNNAIISSEISLSTDYQIGGSYFKSLEDESKNITVYDLWENKLKPLLKDYFRGERNADEKLNILKSAYFMGDFDDSIEG